MSNDIPIKIAWEAILPWYEWGEVESRITYGQTESKAQHQASLELYYTKNDWWSIKVRRAPEYDLFEPKFDECLTDLSKKQRQILARAGGNETMPVGEVDYFCMDKDGPALLKLVSAGLMSGPFDRKGSLPNGMVWFFLTKKGRSAAFSMRPRRRGHEQTQKHQEMNNEPENN
jgi:hypothetical protein